MPDRIDEDPKVSEGSADQPQDDGEVTGLVEETNAEVKLQKVELAILTEQVQALYGDPKAAEILRPLEEDDELKYLLKYPERIFVESFCRSSHIYVPVNGKAASLDDLAVFYHNVPISPELFQESILEKVFGIEFKEKPNTEERLRERQDHFKRLRKLFALLKSLPHQNRYERGRNIIRRISVIPLKEARGKLLVTRMAPGGRVNSVYQDIYGAYRAHAHILNSYDGTLSENDIEEMGEFKALLNLTDKLQLVIAFIQRWKKSSTKERTEMAKLLEEAEDLLANSQNRLKATAHGQAVSSLEFTDSRGQVNPCATAPKLLKTGKDLFARLDQILSIRAKISTDKGTMDKIIHPIHNDFFNGTLELGHIIYDDYFQEMDPDDQKSTNNVKYKCALINKDLFKSSGVLKKLEVMTKDKHMPAPFVQYAMAAFSNFEVVRLLNEYIEANRTGMDPQRLKKIHDEACRHAITGFIAMKYQFIHRVYHEILTRILEDPEKVDYDEERKRLNGLSVRLRPHEYEKEFDLREDLEIKMPAFKELFEHIQYVVSRISEYKRKTIDLQEELVPLKKKAESGTASEEEADRIVELKVALNKLAIDFREVVREIIKEFDFNELTNGIIIDDLKSYLNNIIQIFCVNKFYTFD